MTKKKPSFLQRILYSPCCRPLLKCFASKEAYFNESDSITDIPTHDVLLPPQSDINKGRKTLFLDLDETLVHSSFEPMKGIDIVLPVKLQNMVYNINVIKRPGTEEFLAKMGEIYEVVVFTASLSEYAIPLVKILDETGIVAHILYREHCTAVQGTYVKDLSKVGRDLKDVILVDNSPNSFIFQPENAYHIKNFFDDKTDNELDELGAFLEFVVNVQDVRAIEDWRKKFSSSPTSASSHSAENTPTSLTPIRRQKIRQESTDSNAPLNPISSFVNNTKSMRRSPKSKTNLQSADDDEDQNDEAPTAGDHKKPNGFMVNPGVSSPKESDKLIKSNDGSKNKKKGKINFSHSESASKLIAGQQEQEDDNTNFNKSTKLDEIRFMDGKINPNSPIGKTVELFKRQPNINSQE